MNALRRISDLSKPLKDERRGHKNPRMSQRVKVRQNLSKRLKANVYRRQRMKMQSQKNLLINCTGHPIMHRTPNTNQGMRSRTSNAKKLIFFSFLSNLFGKYLNSYLSQGWRTRTTTISHILKKKKCPLTPLKLHFTHDSSQEKLALHASSKLSLSRSWSMFKESCTLF